MSLVNVKNEAACKLFSVDVPRYEVFLRLSKEVFKLGCLHHVVCISASDWLN